MVRYEKIVPFQGGGSCVCQYPPEHCMLLAFCHCLFQRSNFKMLFFLCLEFRILFPQLTGVLTLAFFIHNCVITLLQNNRNPENNVSNFTRLCLFILDCQTIFFASNFFLWFDNKKVTRSFPCNETVTDKLQIRLHKNPEECPKLTGWH